MKIHLKLDVQNVQVDEVVEADSEEAINHELRRRLEARAPFMVRLVLGTMTDPALWRKIVDLHNQRTGAREPAPTTAAEFLAFGERAGYVERLG